MILDWDKIREKVAGFVSSPASTDAANGAVREAVERWLERDMGNLEILGIEKTLFSSFPGVSLPVKITVDLLGRVKPGAKPPYSKYAGKMIVVDWKSTAGELNSVWADRLWNSWQGRIYAAVTGASLVEYRGISYKDGFKLRPMLIDEAGGNASDVPVFLAGVDRMHSALVQSGLRVWPQNMPGVCMYGGGCEYKDRCLSGAVIPGQYIPAPEDALSYSRIMELLKCPEKYRNSRLNPSTEVDQRPEIAMGHAIHAGLAEAYSQASGVPVSELESVCSETQD